MKEGSKYHPLYDRLRQSGQDELTLTFSAIEALLGDQLPAYCPYATCLVEQSQQGSGAGGGLDGSRVSCCRISRFKC